MAAACGIIVANLYYAQPLVGPISAAIGLDARASGLVVTLTQMGYAAGLLFIVPLGDIVENRRLVILTLALTTCTLLVIGLSTRPPVFLAAALLLGLGSVAAQVLVPFAAHLSPAEHRGRVVGNVMSGLLLGIMLARPAASMIADAWGWHTVFIASACVICALALALWRLLPKRNPDPGLRYGELLLSMWTLLRTTPILRRRAIYHAFMFGAFSLFWTTVPLLLASPAFGLSQKGIALFALVGVGGAVAAPVAGRLADRGLIRPVTIVAMLCVAVAFLLGHDSRGGSLFSLIVHGAAGVILDLGVAANLVSGQRAIFALPAHQRSRLNGLYMATFFLGGALGSALGSWSYAVGGWSLASGIGFAAPVIALAYLATEFRTR
jgi:predicted MFS family arabinose efflux permease